MSGLWSSAWKREENHQLLYISHILTTFHTVEEARRQVVKAWLAIYCMWGMNNYASSQLKLPHKTEPENQFYSLISLWFHFIHALCGERISCRWSQVLCISVILYHSYMKLSATLMTIAYCNLHSGQSAHVRQSLLLFAIYLHQSTITHAVLLSDFLSAYICVSLY